MSKIYRIVKVYDNGCQVHRAERFKRGFFSRKLRWRPVRHGIFRRKIQGDTKYDVIVMLASLMGEFPETLKKLVEEDTVCLQNR